MGSNRLVGIVTDGDLYRRPELRTALRHCNWLNRLVFDEDDAKDYVEAHGRTTHNGMTRDVIAVAPATTLRS